MAEPTETEIKLVATPAMLVALREHPALAGKDRPGTLVTTYYDTADGRLRAGGASLRLRETGKAREQTVKMTLAGAVAAQRGEWTVAASGDKPDPAAFPETVQQLLEGLLGGAALTPVSITRIDRTTRRLRRGKTALDVAFDTGMIESDGRQATICELELELVSGRLADLLRLALQLPLGTELGWSVLSKAERGQLLADDAQPAAVRSTPVLLTTDMTVAQGFRAIAWNGLGQLLVNYPLILASGAPESVHQSRIAIRRLRAAFSLFRDMVNDPETSVLQAELKAVASTLGTARDLHVLIDKIPVGEAPEAAEAADLLTHLMARADAAIAAAQQMLASDSFQRLLVQVALWLEDGPWLGEAAQTGADRPLAPFAARALSHRRRQLRRADGRLDAMSDEARHRVRIRAKKLRYAAEFFASLSSSHKQGKQRQAFIRALAHLQDSLGELNDMAVAATAHRHLFSGLEPIAAAGLATRLDEIGAHHALSRGTLLKAANRALKRIADAKAWWKVD